MNAELKRSRRPEVKGPKGRRGRAPTPGRVEGASLVLTSFLHVAAVARRFFPVSPRRRVAAVCRLFSAFFVLLACVPASASQAAGAARVRVAVLDFGETETGRRASGRVAESLKSAATLAADADPSAVVAHSASVAGSTAVSVELVDRDLARAAARGAGYAGSLNLTLREARDLGAAIDCDFFVVGDAQTVRRSSSAAPVYFESYASVFVVSARTGRLVMWDRPSAEAPTDEEAGARLVASLDALARARYARAIQEARSREAQERSTTPAREGADFVEDLSGADDKERPGNLRAPEPFRRLRPPYPDTAARAEAEATVDVLVDIGADGRVSRVEVSRWAGFGLDEAVVQTVRRMHFRPATRDGAPFASRVLLRYNFRRPPKPTQQARRQ